MSDEYCAGCNVLEEEVDSLRDQLQEAKLIHERLRGQLGRLCATWWDERYKTPHSEGFADQLYGLVDLVDGKLERLLREVS